MEVFSEKSDGLIQNDDHLTLSVIFFFFWRGKGQEGRLLVGGFLCNKYLNNQNYTFNKYSHSLNFELEIIRRSSLCQIHKLYL